MGRASRGKAERRRSSILPREAKEALLARLAACIENFYPERRGQFICPTCLRGIAIRDLKAISAAHIIPQSAGGTAFTLCCTACNSSFGMRQDKWFGEYLYLLSAGKRLVATRHQTGRVNIGGIEVGGRVHAEPCGSIGLEIWKDHTSPDAERELFRMAGEGRIGHLSLDLPILRNQWLLPFGFVTAAYLLWFKEFGYSWALQRQLDRIREWILRPVEGAVPQGVVLQLKDKCIAEPSIGFGNVRGKLALLTGIGDRLVLFPPIGDDAFFDDVKSISGTLAEDDYQLVSGFPDHDFGGPLTVMYGDRIVISPDIQFAKRRVLPMTVLRYPGVGQEPILLHETTAAAVEELRATETVVHQTIKAPFVVSPEGPFTGRSTSGSSEPEQQEAQRRREGQEGKQS